MLLVLDNDDFRRQLIKTLDQNHFVVTFAADGDEAVSILKNGSSNFSVIIVGVDLKTKKGMTSLAYLRDNRQAVRCGVILVGEPNPELRTYAPWADETLLKPVDAEYVVKRAQVYCKC